jgi:hypothetical protein
MPADDERDQEIAQVFKSESNRGRRKGQIDQDTKHKNLQLQRDLINALHYKRREIQRDTEETRREGRRRTLDEGLEDLPRLLGPIVRAMSCTSLSRLSCSSFGN